MTELVGWACNCHSGGVVVRSSSPGIDVATYCPARFAVGPAPKPPKVRDATRIRNQAPLVRAIELPPGVVPPRDVPRLVHRLCKLGVTPRTTYALAWWSVQVKLDPPAPPPPDADRTEDDDRDAEPVELPTGELVKRKGRTTRDVPVLLESVALRAPGVGVQVWWRLDPAGGGKWKPNAGWVLRDGRPQKCPSGGIEGFKARIKELEGK